MIAELPAGQEQSQSEDDSTLISEVLATLRGCKPKALAQLSRNNASHPLLEELLTQQKEQLERLSEALMNLYFSPSLVPQRLGPARLERAS